MNIKIKRQGELINTNFLIVYIGEHRYKLTESIDGKLNIIKSSDNDSDLINVHPRTGNEIELN